MKKGYKLAHEDEHTFHIQHPDGSKFPIAKHAVGEQVHKRIKSLEPVKMSEGGYVEAGDSNPLPESLKSPMAAPEGPGLLESLGIGTFKADPYGLESQTAPTPQSDAVRQPAEVVPVQQPEPVQAAPQPQQPIQTQQPEIPQQQDQLAQAFAQQEAGIKGMAQAQAEAGKAQAQAYDEQAKQIQAAQQNYQQQYAKLDVEHKQLVDAVVNDKIDPNRLWHNMGTGNKVLAAISVALSGLGAGMQGGKPNLALETIQKSIDRDIEAQRLELGKKQTLLSENMRRFGDLNTATQATMLQLNALTQAKVSQIAARSGSGQAQGQAQVLLGQLGIQAAQIKEKLSSEAVRKQIMGGGAINDAQAMMLPEDDRKRLVKIGGKYVPALDESSAKEARKIVGANDAMVSNLDKLIALREKYGAEVVPSAVKAEMSTIATSLQLAIKEAKQLGTLDKGAEKFMEKLVADPTSVGFVSDQYKALKSSQMRETASRLQALGINPSAIQAPQIKTSGGVRYTRGPNGEAIPVK